MQVLNSAPTLHRVDLSPAYRYDPKHGRASGHEMSTMLYRGENIGDSRQPLFDAARHLLRAGTARATDTIATFRGSMECLRATVGAAAKLSVSETADRGPTLVLYRPIPDALSRNAA